MRGSAIYHVLVVAAVEVGGWWVESLFARASYVRVWKNLGK